MTKNTKTWIILGIVAMIFSAGWIFLQSSLDMNPVASTFSVSSSGCKAIYISMESLGFPVKRLLRNYKSLDQYSGVLVVIDPWPIWRGYTSREIASLKEWVKKGNKLVLLAGPKSLSMNVGKKPRKKKPRRLSKFTPLHNRLGLRLKETEKKGRSTRKVSVKELDWQGSINISKTMRWADPGKGWNVAQKDALGPFQVRKELGRGEMVAVSDSEIITNKKALSNNNFKYFLGLTLTPDDPETILFDEYHHGYGTEEGISTFFKASIFYWILVQVSLLALVYFYSKRAMLTGKLRFITPAKGRYTTERVDSIANIFEACDAGAQALSALLKRFETELRGRARFSRDQAGLDLSHLRLPDGAKERDKLEELLLECRKAVDNDPGPGPSLKLAKKLAQMRDNLKLSRTNPRLKN